MRVQVQGWHGDSWESIEAIDPEEAAREAAEQFVHDAAAYECVDGDPIEVRVDDGGEITTWKVRAESGITYSCESA